MERLHFGVRQTCHKSRSTKVGETKVGETKVWCTRTRNTNSDLVLPSIASNPSSFLPSPPTIHHPRRPLTAHRSPPTTNQHPRPCIPRPSNPTPASPSVATQSHLARHQSTDRLTCPRAQYNTPCNLHQRGTRHSSRRHTHTRRDTASRRLASEGGKTTCMHVAVRTCTVSLPIHSLAGNAGVCAAAA